MSSTTKTLADLAGEAYEWFERAERPDGESFDRLKEDAPEWVRGIVYDAHGDDFLPDDYRYAWTREALAAIHDGGDEAEDVDDLEEVRDAFTEPDVYTGALLAWLGSNLRRPSYCDDAVAEYGGEPGTLVDQIMLGQSLERRETFDLVAQALAEARDELDS